MLSQNNNVTNYKVTHRLFFTELCKLAQLSNASDTIKSTPKVYLDFIKGDKSKKAILVSRLKNIAGSPLVKAKIKENVIKDVTLDVEQDLSSLMDEITTNNDDLGVYIAILENIKDTATSESTSIPEHYNLKTASDKLQKVNQNAQISRYNEVTLKKNEVIADIASAITLAEAAIKTIHDEDSDYTQIDMVSVRTAQNNLKALKDKIDPAISNSLNFEDKLLIQKSVFILIFTTYLIQMHDKVCTMIYSNENWDTNINLLSIMINSIKACLQQYITNMQIEDKMLILLKGLYIDLCLKRHKLYLFKGDALSAYRDCQAALNMDQQITEEEKSLIYNSIMLDTKILNINENSKQVCQDTFIKLFENLFADKVTDTRRSQIYSIMNDDLFSSPNRVLNTYNDLNHIDSNNSYDKFVGLYAASTHYASLKHKFEKENANLTTSEVICYLLPLLHHMAFPYSIEEIQAIINKVKDIIPQTAVNNLMITIKLKGYGEAKKHSDINMMQQLRNDLVDLINANRMACEAKDSDDLAYYEYTNLNRSDLENIDFLGVNLNKVRLRGSNLKGANLCAADLSEADLRGADLSHAQLKYATLNEPELDDTIIEGADFEGATIYGVTLNRSKLAGANFKDAILDEVYSGDFSNTNLENAKLYKVELGKLNFTNANLKGMRFLKIGYLNDHFMTYFADLDQAISKNCQKDILYQALYEDVIRFLNEKDNHMPQAVLDMIIKYYEEKQIQEKETTAVEVLEVTDNNNDLKFFKPAPKTETILEQLKKYKLNIAPAETPRQTD